jgi:hypothetical protein
MIGVVLVSAWITGLNHTFFLKGLARIEPFRFENYSRYGRHVHDMHLPHCILSKPCEVFPPRESVQIDSSDFLYMHSSFLATVFRRMCPSEPSAYLTTHCCEQQRCVVGSYQRHDDASFPVHHMVLEAEEGHREPISRRRVGDGWKLIALGASRKEVAWRRRGNRWGSGAVGISDNGAVLC